MSKSGYTDPHEKQHRSKLGYFTNCCRHKKKTKQSSLRSDTDTELYDKSDVTYRDASVRQDSVFSNGYESSSYESENHHHHHHLDDLLHDEPLRKRVLRACFTLLYSMLAAVAVIVTYSMVSELVHSLNNPVRSIHYKKSHHFDAPAISVYPGGAKLLACGHYYNNVVTSKVRLKALDLVNILCNYTDVTYIDPHYPNISRHAMVFRGPTSFIDREAIFLHFELEDDTRDFYTVSYFVFPNYDFFKSSSYLSQQESVMEYHRFTPTFALSAGLRMWIKLSMSETFFLDGTNHTDFKVEYSVVKFHDRRPVSEHNKKLFFIFFEWKNAITEQSTLLFTTTPWSMLAGLCGVFLTLHRGYQLGQTTYKRVQKDKQRRTIRKRRRQELQRVRTSSSARDPCSLDTK